MRRMPAEDEGGGPPDPPRFPGAAGNPPHPAAARPPGLHRRRRPPMTLKLCYGPKVYLLSRPEVNYTCAGSDGNPGLLEFLKDFDVKWEPPVEPTDAELLSEVAGRVCYMSFDKPRPGGTDAYLKNIKNQRHGSVIEHPNYSVIMTGVSRSFSHELVRHRAGWAFSQLSQRYVDSSDVRMVVPPGYREEVYQALGFMSVWSGGRPDYQATLEDAVRARGETNDATILTGALWIENRIRELDEYRAGTEYLPEKLGKTDGGSPTDRRKAARQTARSCLPNATETIVVGTANGRAWRHFFEMRGGAGADAEMRVLAKTCYDVLMKEAPMLFGDYTWSTSDTDGLPVLADVPYRKV